MLTYADVCGHLLTYADADSDEKGVKSELGVVAADLNALEVASTKLKGKVELQEDGEREGVHAIATLARQISKVQVLCVCVCV